MSSEAHGLNIFLLNDFENTQYTHVIDTNMEKPVHIMLILLFGKCIMFFDVGAHRWSRLLLVKLAIHIQMETIEMNIKYSLSYFKSDYAFYT